MEFNAAENLIEQEKIVDELIKQMQEGNMSIDQTRVANELQNMVGDLTKSIHELEAKSAKSDG